MKRLSKLTCLFGLGLVSSLFTVVLLNVASGEVQTGVKINLTVPETAHTARLRQLFFIENSSDVNDNVRISANEENGVKNLDIVNGLIVNGSVGGGNLDVIGGGTGNEMGNSSRSGIAGGSNNRASADDAVIGGGFSNVVEGTGSIVAGGRSNKGEKGGVILGGQGNSSQGVVIGGYGNNAGENGLSMGQEANGQDGSFIWNDNPESPLNSKLNSAYIGTKNGVLIGTYTPETGVSLVVSGAVKIGGSSSETPVTGEIMLHTDGCMYTYDGSNWHILGTSSSECGMGVAKTCEFGRVLLNQGDEVVAYSQLYATDCDSVKAIVTCQDVNGIGKLMKDGVEYKYPSCFNLNTSPYQGINS